MQNPDVKLVCALPYPAFQKNEIARGIANGADEICVVCEYYSTKCFRMRNYCMVDNSNRVIAAFNGENGGTKNTVKYAK